MALTCQNRHHVANGIRRRWDVLRIANEHLMASVSGQIMGLQNSRRDVGLKEFLIPLMMVVIRKVITSPQEPLPQ